MVDRVESLIDLEINPPQPLTDRNIQKWNDCRLSRRRFFQQLTGSIWQILFHRNGRLLSSSRWLLIGSDVALVSG
uniref:Uncharacterized protein n=1 Tax=Anguilla anguilla TaxID=7936 RepID=A0A0E9PP83_ANGAN